MHVYDEDIDRIAICACVFAGASTIVKEKERKRREVGEKERGGGEEKTFE